MLIPDPYREEPAEACQLAESHVPIVETVRAESPSGFTQESNGMMLAKQSDSNSYHHNWKTLFQRRTVHCEPVRRCPIRGAFLWL